MSALDFSDHPVAILSQLFSDHPAASNFSNGIALTNIIPRGFQCKFLGRKCTENDDITPRCITFYAVLLLSGPAPLNRLDQLRVPLLSTIDRCFLFISTGIKAHHVDRDDFNCAWPIGPPKAPSMLL